MRSRVADALLFLMLTIPAGFLFARNSSSDSANPATPLVTSDLIAWPQMQNPEQVPPAGPGQAPTPEPRPETQPQAQQKPNQGRTAEPPPEESASPAASEVTPETFTGTIDKQAGSYVLQVSKGSSYKLDDPAKAQQYEGQRVRVTGVLNSEINLIRVQKIEPLS